PTRRGPAPAGRADGVVGAGEGPTAEIQRADSGQMPAPVVPRLARPEDSDAGRQRPMSGLIATGTFPKRGPTPVIPAARDPMPTWERGTSSVPTMRRSAGAAPPARAPGPHLSRELPTEHPH